MSPSVSDLELFLEQLKLPQYSVLFMQNGFFSLEQICEITDKKELREIGIQKNVHLCLIMSEIRKLRNPDHPMHISPPMHISKDEDSKSNEP